jgi:hypothetical protein
LGGAPPPAALQAFHRAVLALLGLTAPDGDISYMGRGQQQVWTMASAAAACALAMRLLARQSTITTRCEGLVDVELTALTTRRALGSFGIPVVPRVAWRSGVDGYVNRVDYDGLCVYALDLTADALSAVHDPREQPLPAAVSGEEFTDPAGTGLATTSVDGTWMAVHRQETNPSDSRWGFGLMALEARSGDAWRSVLDPRPLGFALQGPILFSHGRDYRPRGRSIAVPRPGMIEVVGGWFQRRRLVRRATFVYRAGPRGVVLSVPARPGDGLLVREWVRPGGSALLSPAAAPGETDLERRIGLSLGNADSDRLDQITQLVVVQREQTVRFIWRIGP